MPSDADLALARQLIDAGLTTINRLHATQRDLVQTIQSGLQTIIASQLACRRADTILQHSRRYLITHADDDRVIQVGELDINPLPAARP